MPASESNEGNWPSNTFCQKKNVERRLWLQRGFFLFKLCRKSPHFLQYCQTEAFTHQVPNLKTS